MEEFAESTKRRFFQAADLDLGDTKLLGQLTLGLFPKKTFFDDQAQSWFQLVQGLPERKSLRPLLPSTSVPTWSSRVKTVPSSS